MTPAADAMNLTIMLWLISFAAVGVPIIMETAWAQHQADMKRLTL